jgi:hypothetical protein
MATESTAGLGHNPKLCTELSPCLWAGTRRPPGHRQLFTLMTTKLNTWSRGNIVAVVVPMDLVVANTTRAPSSHSSRSTPSGPNVDLARAGIQLAVSVVWPAAMV